MAGEKSGVAQGFDAWWETEKMRPPYSNPQSIAKAAWKASRAREHNAAPVIDAELIDMLTAFADRIKQDGFSPGLPGDEPLLRRAIAALSHSPIVSELSRVP